MEQTAKGYLYKRVLSVLLALAFCLTVLPLETVAADSAITYAAGEFAGGDGSENDPYLIATAEQLKKLANDVNGGEGYKDIYFKLTADIDLNGSEDNPWTPIGKNSYRFNGIFDGGGHEISGLYINSTYNYQGLFGYVVGGTIENLGVDGSVTGNHYVGGVVGYIYDGTVQNCYNTGSVRGNGDGSGNGGAGGVVGTISGSAVQNCYNIGTVNGARNVGGVVGHSDNSSNVQNCYNTGDVNGATNVGGVAGAGFRGSIMQNCYNTGDVSGSTSVGGVVGSINFSGTTVQNCYNTGDVNKTATNVGGVVGQVYNPECKVENCFFLQNSTTNNGLSGVGTGTSTGTGAGSGTDFTALADALNTDNEEVWCYHSTFLKNRPILLVNPEVSGNGIDGDPYLFRTREGLEDMRDYINGTGNFNGNVHTGAGEFFGLANCIDLGGENDPWTPIGTASIGETKNFCGTFDGKGKEINGLYINGSNLSSPTDSGAGLFGQIGENGTVENLIVSGTVSCNKDYIYYGGIVGYSYGTVKNCTNKVDFTNITGSYIRGVGGVVGTNRGTVESCHNYGSFTVTSDKQNTGGIASTNIGTVIDCVNHKGCSVVNTGSGIVSFGGIVQNNSSGHTVQGCYNEADFTADESKIAIGGIVHTNNRSIVTNCYNTGNISGSSTVGGIVNTNNGGTIRNCYNTGNISSSSTIGGIASSSYGSVENCYNTGAVTGKNSTTSCGGIVGRLLTDAVNNYFGAVKNCYNYGDVSDGDDSGGIVGEVSGSVDIANNYYLYSTADVGVGGVVEDADKTRAIDADTFASGEIAWLLQNGQDEPDEQIWYQKIDTDDYPVFEAEDDSSIVYRAAFLSGGTEEDKKAPFAAVYGNNGKQVSLTDVSGTPERDNADFITWSLTKKAGDPFSSAVINGSDVEIYAVWSEPVHFGDVTLIPPPGTAIDIEPGAETVTVPDGTIVRKTGSPDITVGNNGDKAVVDTSGNVTLPNGDAKIGNAGVDVPKGGVLRPNNNETVTVPDDTVVTPPGTRPEIKIVDANNEAAVDGEGNVTLPGGGKIELGETVITAPENGGAYTPNTDGTVTVPDGTAVTPPSGKPVITVEDANNQATVDRNGNVKFPGNGKAKVVETEVTLPGSGGSLEPVGDGFVRVPAGSAVKNSDGETTLTEDSLLDENGNLFLGAVRIGNVLFIPPNGKTVTNENGIVTVPAGTIVIPDSQTDYTVESEGGKVDSNDGRVTLPNGGSIKLGSAEVTAPENGGTFTPNTDGDTVTVPDGSAVTPPSGAPKITIADANNEATVDKHGNIKLPKGGDVKAGSTTVTVPEGETVTPNGNSTVTVPKDTVVKGNPDITLPDGAVIDRDGNIILPDGGDIKIGDTTVNVPGGGAVTPNGDGTVTVPDGSKVTPPDGSLEIEITDGKGKAAVDKDGNVSFPGGGEAKIGSSTVTVPAGGALEPDGEDRVVLPNGTKVTDKDGKPTELPDGGIMDKDGNLISDEAPETDNTIKIGDTIVTLPKGGKAETNEDGTVTVTGGSKVKFPDGTTMELPDGGTVSADGKSVTVPKGKSGSVKTGDTKIAVPGGTVKTEGGGTVTVPDGSVVTPPAGTPDIEIVDADNKATVDRNGNITYPKGGKAKIGDATITVPKGGTVKPDKNGKVFLPEGSGLTDKDGKTTTVPKGGATYDPATGKLDNGGSSGGNQGGSSGSTGGSRRPSGGSTSTTPSTGTTDPSTGNTTDPSEGDTTDPSTEEAKDPSTGETEEPDETSEPSTDKTEEPAVPGSVSVNIGGDSDIVSIDEDSAYRLIEEVTANLTDEEREAVENGDDLEIVLIVELSEGAVPAEDIRAVEEFIAGSGYTVGQYLSISVVKLINGEPVGTVTELEAPINLIINISALSSDGRTFAAVRVHEGVPELLEDEDSAPDTLTVATDRFSTYAVVYQDAEAPEDTGNPYTASRTAGMAVIALVCAASTVVVTAKRKKTR